MLNRRVKFRPNPENPSGALPLLHDESLRLIDPTVRILRDLPNLLKQNLDLKEVTIYASDLESTWMSFCSGYHELAAAGGVV